MLDHDAHIINERIINEELPKMIWQLCRKVLVEHLKREPTKQEVDSVNVYMPADRQGTLLIGILQYNKISLGEIKLCEDGLFDIGFNKPIESNYRITIQFEPFPQYNNKQHIHGEYDCTRIEKLNPNGKAE